MRLPVARLYIYLLSWRAASAEQDSLSPRMIGLGPVEIVWNQTSDRCPGTNWAGHIGEQPDSMPLAWHNPTTNATSLIAATDWGTFATIGRSLHPGSSLVHDCSHRVYKSVNSSVPWSYANHQWLQSVQVFPNGSGVGLIHSEFHGGRIGNTSLCSGTGAQVCQYWSAGLGVTTDGGSHWALAAEPPLHRTFSTPKRYVKDSANTGFGAIGAMALATDGYYYGHIQEITAGDGKEANDATNTGTCAWRTRDVTDPGAYRGWNGSGWHTTWIDPYTTSEAGDHVCAPIDTGTAGNSHASVRTFEGADWPAGWPSHLMLGWPDSIASTVGYAFPGWKTAKGGSSDRPGDIAASAEPFTTWDAAQYFSVEDWTPPELKGCGDLMYPSLLDADSPFSLAKSAAAAAAASQTVDADAATAVGLSYGLIGNRSLALYFVLGRKYIARMPVAFLPPGAPEPRPGPYPSPATPALNPVNCTALNVTGAGVADVNGVYKVLAAGHGESRFPEYEKDAKHQLYYEKDTKQWSLGWYGHEGYYRSQKGISDAAVPVNWPGCGLCFPTVMCVDEQPTTRER